MVKSVIASLPLVLCLVISALAISSEQDDPETDDSPTPPEAISPGRTDQTVVGEISVSPDTLNLNSRGRYVTVSLSLPEGFSASSVFIPSVRFMGVVYAETCFSDHETGADKENAPHLILKFLRMDVQGVLAPGEQVPVFMTGMLNDGIPLYASGVISVVR